MKILMSAGGTPVAQSIVTHLNQKLGHMVFTHDQSGYATFPSPSVVSGDYIEFLQNIIGILGIDLYLPFLDEELRLLANTPDHDIPMVASMPSVLLKFTSKLQQQHAMESAGLPVAPEAYWDAVLKPDFGRGGKGLLRTRDFEELLPHGDYLSQKFIDGDEFTVDTLTDDGRFLYAVPRRRIQANGVSTIGKIQMDMDLISVAESVVDAFHFHGPINIQMIRERDTGKVYITEVNPRLSGSCIFTVMAGFDILRETVRMFEATPFTPPEAISNGMTIRRHYVEEIL